MLSAYVPQAGSLSDQLQKNSALNVRTDASENRTGDSSDASNMQILMTA